MAMRACVAKLMQEHRRFLDLMKETMTSKGIPMEDDIRIWNEAFMPCVEMLLIRPDYLGWLKTRKCVKAIFEMLDQMLNMEPETSVFAAVYTMEYFRRDPDLLKLARPHMSQAMEQAYVRCCTKGSEAPAPKADEPQPAAQEVSMPKSGFCSAAMVDQFAPIIPYVGAGGLRLGWTQEQVEKVTGPLGDHVVVGQMWRRYAVGDQLWLYFNGPGDGLEKIVTLPGYGGRLFGLIDTNTPVEELSWREPSFVWNETLKFYTSPKGVLIQPENGKCTHITVFMDQWKSLCQ